MQQVTITTCCIVLSSERLLIMTRHFPVSAVLYCAHIIILLYYSTACLCKISQYPINAYSVIVILQNNEYCIGWQNSGMQTKDGREITLLGGNFHVYYLRESSITHMGLSHTLPFHCSW